MSKLERYLIQEPLGEGGMGQVYKAWDTQLQRAVAIKFFTDFDPNDAEQCRRIQQEAVNHATVQHPNIVTLFDHGIDGNRAFAVMELVEGETLHNIVLRERLSLETFKDVAKQCLDGLTAAHKIGMLHRDLKSLNIMLAPRVTGQGYRAKLLDFGLSKKLKKPEIQTTDHEEGLMGSIHTMSPEQFDRKPIDQRTDLYALGCIFYFALSGKFPFDGDSASDIMVAHLRHNVRPLHTRRPDVPKPLSDWVMQFIEKEPANRHRSAWAALEDLRSMEDVVPAEESRKQLVKQAMPHLIAIPVILLLVLVVITTPLWRPLISGEKSRTSTVGDAPDAQNVPPPISAPQDPQSDVPSESAIAAAQAMQPDHEGPYRPNEIALLAGTTDREVFVRGVIAEFTPAAEEGGERTLAFRGNRRTVPIVVPPGSDELEDEQLQELVGMEVEIRGTISKEGKSVILPLMAADQIEILGEGEEAE